MVASLSCVLSLKFVSDIVRMLLLDSACRLLENRIRKRVHYLRVGLLELLENLLTVLGFGKFPLKLEDSLQNYDSQLLVLSYLNYLLKHYKQEIQKK